MLENVPFTLSGSVPARLTYIQVVNPVDGSIDLRLVWDLEVEMDDNW